MLSCALERLNVAPGEVAHDNGVHAREDVRGRERKDIGRDVCLHVARNLASKQKPVNEKRSIRVRGHRHSKVAPHRRGHIEVAPKIRERVHGRRIVAHPFASFK